MSPRAWPQSSLTARWRGSPPGSAVAARIAPAATGTDTVSTDADATAEEDTCGGGGGGAAVGRRHRLGRHKHPSKGREVVWQHCEQ